ncbi:MAG: GmrSD restriction endonuclease domain-containing protein [Halobacteriota archaeon]
MRNHEQELGLANSAAFGKFIEEDFAFYSSWYPRVSQAAESLTEGLETIYYNAQSNFTLQYPVLLAPLLRTDTDTEILHKLRIVSGYIDILIARRTWNWKSTSYSAMQYNMFQLVILNIRGKSAAELVEILTERLQAEDEKFASNERFQLHGMNGPQVHRLLARMTDFVETHSGRKSRYVEYIQRGKNGYEIEHVWANHPEQHDDEFSHPTDFAEYRNRIGGLLLLPKSFNSSYGDLSYDEKYDHYYGQNLLAQSLHEQAYTHDPGPPLCR